MTCPIASREDYDLWYLGLLEGPLAEEISSHVRAGCPACTQAVRSCAYLWATVAYTQSTESTVLPSRALRAGILRNALRTQPQRRWSQRWSLRWSWDAWPRWMVPAFSAAAVLLMAIVLFQPGRRAEVPDAHMREIARLQAEVAQWRERAQAAVPPQVQAAPAQAMRTDTPQQPPPPPLPARRDPALEMELANARQQAGAASDALTAERARTAKLQSETDSLRAMASAASAQKDEAERKLNAAIGDPRLAEKDRQLSTLTTQVRQLELENATYRETVLRLERQVNRDTRLVALLSSPSVQLVRLLGSEAGGKAVGKAFVVEGQRMVFYASNLPALPPGRTYQLWLLRGRKPAIASGGTFAGDGFVEVEDKTLISDLRGLAVTEEPSGGSAWPTGHKILVGALKAL